MRLLDLFCGAGGAAVGYHRAGFNDIVGVDIRPQPRYPFTFIEADAMTFPLEGFDAIHASPPCQGYSVGSSPERKANTPRLIHAIRERLLSTGRPYVIENVKGAAAHLKVVPEGFFVLCGSMWGSERPVRHRLFEARPFIWAPPHPKCVGHNKRLAHRLGCNRRMVEVATVHENIPLWQQLLDIDWTNDPRELSEAIPPAYTEYIGRHLIKYLESGR